tara:strand:- start:65 stop:541 length:477 start_codon:yes stop_codon:yes gene_type:complete
MKYIIIGQAIIFTAYITFLLCTFKKALPSISESWYALKPNRRWLFSAFSLSLGIGMIAQVEQSGLMFFGGGGLFFVGIATAFKDKVVDMAHFFGAGLAILCPLLSLGLNNQKWLPLIVFFVSSVVILLLEKKYKVMSNSTWWIEIIAFACIIVGLLTN